MASKQKMLSAIKQTLKDLLYMMKSIDNEMIKNMETATDSFIDESASKYSKSEINEKFSTGEKAIKLLYEYIEMKAKRDGRNSTLH
jgi:hypothetical protein